MPITFQELSHTAVLAAFGHGARIAVPVGNRDASPTLMGVDAAEVQALVLPMLAVHGHVVGQMTLGGSPFNEVVTVDRRSPVGCVLDACGCALELSGLILPVLQDGWLSIGCWRKLTPASDADNPDTGYIDIADAVDAFARLMGALPDGIALSDHHIAHMFNIRSAKIDWLMRQRIDDIPPVMGGGEA